jgi:hypothetical protein
MELASGDSSSLWGPETYLVLLHGYVTADFSGVEFLAPRKTPPNLRNREYVSSRFYPLTYLAWTDPIRRLRYRQHSCPVTGQRKLRLEDRAKVCDVLLINVKVALRL